MEPFKNVYNREWVALLCSGIAGVWSEFDARCFTESVFAGNWEARELKDRMRHISRTMGAFLPKDYAEAIRIVRASAPVMDNFSFSAMVFPDFVEVHGMEDWELSMGALEQFTQQSSAEFAVRPFIVRDQDRMMAQMLVWAGHESADVRRLASEGCRPRLPWAMALPELKRDPEPILPILEKLKGDESEYVRRSVANSLNDIAKDHPDLVVDILREWGNDDSKEMVKLSRHALRSLLKQGHGGAMELVGLGSVPNVVVSNLRVAESVVRVGDSLSFEFEIINSGESAANLMVDYVVGFVLARGKVGRKVFKLSKFVLGSGERRTVSKRHSFKPITTRVYYPGVHSIGIQVNGFVLVETEFELAGV